MSLLLLFRGSGTGTAYSDNLSAGSYALTGVSITDKKTVSDNLSVGTYSLSGISLTDLIARNDSLQAGSYVITGNLITDVKTGAQSYSDSLSVGSYSITGQSIQDSIVPFVTVNVKQGGDDVPERVEIWTYRNKPEAVKAKAKKLKEVTINPVTLNNDWLKEQVKLARERESEEDDIEALMLLM